MLIPVAISQMSTIRISFSLRLLLLAMESGDRVDAFNAASAEEGGSLHTRARGDAALTISYLFVLRIATSTDAPLPQASFIRRHRFLAAAAPIELW